MKKYSKAGEATDDDMAHAHFTLGTKGYRHTLKEYVIILAFVVNNGYKNVTLYVHWLSYFYVLLQVMTDAMSKFKVHKDINKSTQQNEYRSILIATVKMITI